MLGLPDRISALLDECLCVRDGPGFVPFDAYADNDEHVDGRPRYDGVRAFLQARATPVAGITDLLEARVDAIVAEEEDLAVKPLAGAEAGGAGRFGHVVADLAELIPAS